MQLQLLCASLNGLGLCRADEMLSVLLLFSFCELFHHVLYKHGRYRVVMLSRFMFHYRQQKTAYRKLILEGMTVAATPLTELCFRFLGVAVCISVLLAAHRPLL